MRALVLKDFGEMTVREVPDPTVEPGHVLLRVHATGICGSDLHGFTGENGRRHPGQVMGHETVGRVAALGAGVDEAVFPVGTAVTVNPVVVPADQLQHYRGREQQAPGRTVIGVHPEVVAAFAEYISVPARNVLTIDPEVPIEHGALVEPLAVAAHAMTQAGVAEGQRLLIIGGGPIGQSAVIAGQHARAAEIIVSEVDAERRSLCESLGAATVDLTANEDALVAAPADVTVDAVGTTATLRDALRNTVGGGTVCLVGMGSPTVEIQAFGISTEERALVGSFTYSATDFERAVSWLSSSTALPSLISKVVDLDEAPSEFARQAAGDVAPGKVLVRLAEG